MKRRLTAAALCLLLLGWTISAAAMTTDELRTAIMEAFPGVELTPAPDSGYLFLDYPLNERLVRIGFSVDDAGEALLCRFYGDTGGYALQPEHIRDAKDAVNALNALCRYPALYVTDAGLIAGHDRYPLESGGSAADVKAYAPDVISWIAGAYAYIDANWPEEWFIGRAQALPEATPTPQTTDPAATEAPFGDGDRPCYLCHTDGKCRACEGSGEILNHVWGWTERCDACNGSGKCKLCKGDGYY